MAAGGILASLGVQAERGVWPAPSLAHLEELVDLMQLGVGPLVEALEFTEDPVLRHYSIFLAFINIHGSFPGVIRKENLERWQELEAGIGGG